MLSKPRESEAKAEKTKLKPKNAYRKRKKYEIQRECPANDTWWRLGALLGALPLKKI